MYTQGTNDVQPVHTVHIEQAVI